MSNVTLKTECLRAPVWGIRKDPGWINVRLTTPVHVGTFFSAAVCRAEGNAMTAIALFVPQDSPPIVNQSRPALEVARRLERDGQIVAAGCWMREALQQQLSAMCEFHGCRPRRRRQNRPVDLAKALRRDGLIDDFDYDCVRHAIDAGNRAAHCVAIDRSKLHEALELVDYLINVHTAGQAASEGKRGAV
jgi:hypothetical protein